MQTSAELFDRLGYAWNTPNYQHNAGRIERHVFGPDGQLRDIEIDWEIEGYGPDGEPTRATPKPKWVDPVRLPPRSTRRKVHQVFYPAHRPPEYRCIVPVAPVVPHDAKLPTAEDLARGKRQKAAIKARMTRAANKLAAKEAARRDAVADLAVKLSQWSF